MAKNKSLREQLAERLETTDYEKENAEVPYGLEGFLTVDPVAWTLFADGIVRDDITNTAKVEDLEAALVLAKQRLETMELVIKALRAMRDALDVK